MKDDAESWLPLEYVRKLTRPDKDMYEKAFTKETVPYFDAEASANFSCLIVLTGDNQDHKIG